MQPDRFHQKTPGDVLRIDRYNEIMRNKKSAPMPPYGMNWRDTDRWEKQQEKQRKMQLESFANHGETSGEGGGLLALEDGAAPGTYSAFHRQPTGIVRQGSSGAASPGSDDVEGSLHCRVRIQEPEERETRFSQESWMSMGKQYSGLYLQRFCDAHASSFGLALCKVSMICTSLL